MYWEYYVYIMYENIDSPQTLEMMKMWQWGLTRHSWQPGQCGCHGDVIISLDVYVRHWCQTLSGGPPGHQPPARCLSLTSKCPSFYWVLSTYYLLLFGLGHDQWGVAPSLRCRCCFDWGQAGAGNQCWAHGKRQSSNGPKSYNLFIKQRYPDKVL